MRCDGRGCGASTFAEMARMQRVSRRQRLPRQHRDTEAAGLMCERAHAGQQRRGAESSVIAGTGVASLAGRGR
ncbi:hypothetical protein C8R44DRAFT_822087 [Mycena epipterygia]|nr:hypothetical protein C8R44DRAFT_824341 [Mycena epipterygia]KAJ7084121.1 hypothetical protein C8R44DRAFT_822087 [Mycena epipterygia]